MKALTRITGGILGFLSLGILLTGVPVPTRPPFIGLVIETDREIYNVGDTVIIAFTIVNKMPFKIKLESFSYYETKIYPVEHPERCVASFQHVSPQLHGLEMVLWPFDGTTLNGYMGVDNLTKGEYMIIMDVEGITISKEFRVN